MPWLQSQVHRSPIYFPIDNFQPGNARRLSAIWSRHATRVQEPDTAPFFISGHVGVTMQNNIDILRRTLGWNVLKPNFLSGAHKIDNQRPIEVTVAISANDSHRRTDRAQLIENPFRANIAKMPNFIRISRQYRQFLRKLVMRVRQDKDRHRHLRRCFGHCRS